MAANEPGGEGARRPKRAIGTRAAVFCVFVLLYSLTPLGARFWRQAFADSGFTDRAENTPFALMRVHVLDVGKADAILLESQGRYALLDAGTYVEGAYVADYLARQGVTSLDYILASHPDNDHIGGMVQVMEGFPTAAFLRGEGWEGPGQEAQDLLRYLEAEGIPQRVLSPGDTLPLGHGELAVLGPLYPYEDTNNRSLVLKLTCFQFSALFCGDIEKEAEQDLLDSGQDLSANLLKAAHHGSRTSSTEDFLAAVSPQLAVVPVGPDNNNLPRPQALSRLEAAGARILRTDLDGDILFSYDGEHIGIKTAKK